MAQMVKHLPCHAGNPGSIPGWGRPPGEGTSYPLQYSCLENSIDRGAWRAVVHGVTKSQTQLSDENFHTLCSIFEVLLRGGLWQHSLPFHGCIIIPPCGWTTFSLSVIDVH